jgi:hypothetical protein
VKLCTSTVLITNGFLELSNQITTIIQQKKINFQLSISASYISLCTNVVQYVPMVLCTVHTFMSTYIQTNYLFGEYVQ